MLNITAEFFYIYFKKNQGREKKIDGKKSVNRENKARKNNNNHKTQPSS